MLQIPSARTRTLRRSAGASQGEDDSYSFSDAANFLLRRRWLMLAVWLLSAAAIFGWLATRPTTYDAFATVSVSPGISSARAKEFKDADERFLAAQLKIIQSREFTLLLVDHLNLAADPEWNADLRAPAFWPETAQLMNIGERDSSPAAMRSRVAEAVGKALSVRRRGETFLLDIGARSQDPDRAVQLANAVVKLYLRQKVTRYFGETRAASEMLSKEMNDLAVQLNDRQVAVELFKLRNKLDAAGVEDPGGAMTRQLKTLEDEAKAVETAYLQLAERYRGLIEEASGAVMHGQQVSPASAPVKSPAAPLALFGAAAAAAFALALITGITAEFLDQGVRGAADCSRKTGHGALASIPLLPPDVRGKLGDAHALIGYLREKPMSAFAESLRILRTAALYGGGDTPPKVICITSARAHEGKTTMVLGLGQAAALSGQRVLVIDCDLRRDSWSKMFEIEVSAGLLSVALGGISWTEALVTDRATGLNLLPSWHGHYSAKGLFQSIAVAKLVEELRGHFDLILLDAPSIFASRDAKSIAGLADKTIMVTRWNRTPARAVRKAIATLALSGASIAGIALNFVNPRSLGRLSPTDPAYKANFESRYYAS